MRELTEKISSEYPKLPPPPSNDDSVNMNKKKGKMSRTWIIGSENQEELRAWVRVIR